MVDLAHGHPDRALAPGADSGPRFCLGAPDPRHAGRRAAGRALGICADRRALVDRAARGTVRRISSVCALPGDSAFVDTISQVRARRLGARRLSDLLHCAADRLLRLEGMAVALVAHASRSGHSGEGLRGAERRIPALRLWPRALGHRCLAAEPAGAGFGACGAGARFPRQHHFYRDQPRRLRRIRRHGRLAGVPALQPQGRARGDGRRRGLGRGSMGVFAAIA